MTLTTVHCQVRGEGSESERDDREREAGRKERKEDEASAGQKGKLETCI